MKRGDVVLLHLPFVGVPGGKTRPALVVQDDYLNGAIRETIVAEITSNLSNALRPHQTVIDISTPDGAASGLLMNSAVRCERLQVVPQADIKKVIGLLSKPIMDEVEKCLKAALGIR